MYLKLICTRFQRQSTKLALNRNHSHICFDKLTSVSKTWSKAMHYWILVAHLHKSEKKIQRNNSPHALLGCLPRTWKHAKWVLHCHSSLGALSHCSRWHPCTGPMSLVWRQSGLGTLESCSSSALPGLWRLCTAARTGLHRNCSRQPKTTWCQIPKQRMGEDRWRGWEGGLWSRFW